MIQITWDRNELKESILTPPITIASDLEIHFLVDEANITRSATTNCRYFFTQLYGAFQYLFPTELRDKNIHIYNPDNRISGEDFEFSLNLLP